jgi:hypothetical protein
VSNQTSTANTVTTVMNEPRKPWKHLPYGDTLIDKDGSTWQVTKDPNTGVLFPVMVIVPPAPIKPDCCNNRSLGFKSS